MPVVDQFTQTLKTLRKPIDEVLKYPAGPKRWRAAHDLLWLNLKWSHQLEYKAVCEENKLQRELVTEHGFAKGLTRREKSDKTLRQAMNIPAGAYNVISKSDPELFKKQKNYALLMKTFPEYMTREKI